MTVLETLPTAAIVRAIADAARRWTDADFPPRVRVTGRIAQRTGYSIPVVEYALDRLFLEITEERMREVIGEELRGSGAQVWVPAGKVCIISSRTTIGVALFPAVFALCAGCEVLVKDREDSLISEFFRTLAQERGEFAAAARAEPWNGAAAGAPPLDGFDAVVAFGSDRTLETIARSLAAGTRFIGYGSRASAGYVTRESLSARESVIAIAEGAASDVVLYDGEGCLSLHVCFVEPGETGPEAFARELAAAIERAAVEFPPSRRDEGVRARVSQARDLALFRAASGKGKVFSGPAAGFAVFFDPPREEPPLFLPRCIGIVPVDAPAQALAYLRRHALALEGFALSAARADVLEMVKMTGAVRVTPFGDLQRPPLGAHHGGRPRIAEFVRWIDVEL